MTMAVFIDMVPNDISTDIMQLLMSSPMTTRVPAPVNTTGSLNPLNRRIVRDMLEPSLGGDETCAICLDTIFRKKKRKHSSEQASQLPCCGQLLHIHCLFSLVPPPALGDGSCVTCPFCRSAIGLAQLAQMGVDTGVKALVGSANVCNAIQELRNGSLHSLGFYAQLSTASRYTIADGFLYNCILLHIDRSLYHRRQLRYDIDKSLKERDPNSESEISIINKLVSVHIEVLIRTKRVWQ